MVIQVKQENNKKIYQCLSSTDLVGVEFSENIINIYFPLGYRIPKDELQEKKAVLDLLKTLSLCKNIDEQNPYSFNRGDKDNIPINSYLWVINDYLKNGLYNVTEKKYVQSQKGKINWKRTFKTKPIFSEDEIVFLNPIVEQKTKIDNIITLIHAICVNESIKKIGWLLGDIPHVIINEKKYDKYYYLSILNQELLKSFNDRKKTLLKHLINILDKKSENETPDRVNNLLTNKYNIAWEKMIDYVFGNVLDKSKYFPEIKWHIRGFKNPSPSMRPDTIIDKNDTTFILDAKYYKFGVIENGTLPGVEDVDKQITYGEYNYRKYNKEIYNAFIMPFDMNSNLFKSDIPIKTIGTVESVGRKSLKKPLENIVLILMDTKYLMDLYLKKETKDEELLLKSIISEISLLEKEEKI